MLLGERALSRSKCGEPSILILLGSVYVLSAAFFYQARSRDGYYVPMFLLSRSRKPLGSAGIERIMRVPNSWNSVDTLQSGFHGALLTGLIESALALFLVLSNPKGHWFAAHNGAGVYYRSAVLSAGSQPSWGHTTLM